MMRPRTTAPGAVTMTTLPVPGPTRLAPGSPSTVTVCRQSKGTAVLSLQDDRVAVDRLVN